MKEYLFCTRIKSILKTLLCDQSTVCQSYRVKLSSIGKVNLTYLTTVVKFANSQI